MPQYDDKQDKARKQYEQSIHDINTDDVKDAYTRASRRISDFGSDIPGTLVEIWEDIKLMTSMIKDYYNGTYRQVPWSTIAATAAAILYFVNPLDIIPDFIPIIGYIDDLAVFAVALKFIGKDLDKYNVWRDEQQETEIRNSDVEDADFEDVD